MAQPQQEMRESQENDPTVEARTSHPVAKVVELIGTSTESFEDAVDKCVKEASRSIQGIRGVEVEHMTCTVVDGNVAEYRVNVKLAFGIRNELRPQHSETGV